MSLPRSVSPPCSGACVGVFVPSQDRVGRVFPLAAFVYLDMPALTGSIEPETYSPSGSSPYSRNPLSSPSLQSPMPVCGSGVVGDAADLGCVTRAGLPDAPSVVLTTNDVGAIFGVGTGRGGHGIRYRRPSGRCERPP